MTGDYRRIMQKKKTKLSNDVIRVGYPNKQKGSRYKIYTYDDVQKDADGWVDAYKFLPREHDLVFLKCENKKPVHGWWTGNRFDGARLDAKDKVKYWKKSTEL